MELGGYDRTEGLYQACESMQPPPMEEQPEFEPQMNELKKETVEEAVENQPPIILSQEELTKSVTESKKDDTKITSFLNLTFDEMCMYLALVVLVVAVYFYTKD